MSKLKKYKIPQNFLDRLKAHTGFALSSAQKKQTQKQPKSTQKPQKKNTVKKRLFQALCLALGIAGLACLSMMVKGEYESITSGLYVFAAVIGLTPTQAFGNNALDKNPNAPASKAIPSGSLPNPPAVIFLPPPPKNTTLFWKLDGASRQGKMRSENQDAFAVLSQADGQAGLILCDGAGGLKGGKIAAESAVEVIKTTLERHWKSGLPVTEYTLEHAMLEAQSHARKQNIKGITTALVVWLNQDKVFYASLGDGEITVLWPEGMIGALQVPHHHIKDPQNIIHGYIGKACVKPPRIGSQRVEIGCTLYMMSDGAADLLPLSQLAESQADYPVCPGMADHFLAFLEQAKDPETDQFIHSDNMTLILAALCEEPIL